MDPMRDSGIVEASQEPTHPRPLPGGEQNSGRGRTVPLLGGVRGGFMVCAMPSANSLPGGDGWGENSPENSRIEPPNHSSPGLRPPSPLHRMERRGQGEEKLRVRGEGGGGGRGPVEIAARETAAN